VDVLVLPNVQQRPELLLEECVVVLKPIAKQRKGFDRGTADDHHLGAPLRKQIDSREVLKRADPIFGAQDRDCAGETNALRADRCRAENHSWGRVEKLATTVFVHTEGVEADSHRRARSVR
jgi:hypothetical protein